MAVPTWLKVRCIPELKGVGRPGPKVEVKLSQIGASLRGQRQQVRVQFPYSGLLSRDLN